MEDNISLHKQSVKHKTCPFCNIEMDDICKLYNMASMIDFGEGWGQTPYENRKYNAYECPRCRIFLCFRKNDTI
jgi:hypothetical protein